VAELQADVAQGLGQAFVHRQRQRRLAAGRAPDLDRLKAPVVHGIEKRALDVLRGRGVHAALHGHAIHLGHAVARVGQHIRDAPVVGDQHQAARQAVEAPGREQPPEIALDKSL